MEGLGGDFLFLGAGFETDVAGLSELFFNLGKVGLIDSDIEGGENRLKLSHFVGNFLDDAGERLGSALKLRIFLKVFLAVLESRHIGVEGYGNGFIGIVIKRLEGLGAFGNGVAVGVDELAVDAELIFFLSVFELFLLQVKLLNVTLESGSDNLAKVGRLLTDAHDNTFLAVEVLYER